MAVETTRFQDLFRHANNPIKLWDERAKIPGLKSVMSLGKSEQVLEHETQITRDRLFLELGDLKTKSVLEIGTGIGRFTGGLAGRALRAVSIDLSQGMIERAGQTVSSKVSLMRAAGQNLPFKDESFDTAFEVTVLIHILDDDIFRRFIAEAMRVLNPGGKIVFCDPIAQNQSVQMHPYLKHRTVNEYEDAAGLVLEDRGELSFSTNSVRFLIGTKPADSGQSVTVK